MREILFRGKRKIDNQWAFGNLVVGLTDEWASIIRKVDADEGQPFEEQDVFVETIGQYAGVNDNDLKNIYEGDILQDPNDFDDGLYIVEFLDGEFVLINDNIIYRIEQALSLQIIGNIHDDKELLNGGGAE